MRGACEGCLEACAALAQRQGAHVDRMLLEQIVGEEAHRNVFENRGRELLAPDALLQQGKWLYRVLLPGDELAIEHRALGQRGRRGRDFREALGDELLAARPEEAAAAAPNELCANAVPFPFDLPVGDLAERGGIAVER